MEQFCSIFAVWVQFWPPYTLCKWKQIIEKSFWTGSFNLHRFRSSQRWWHLSPLSRQCKMEQFSLFESKFDHLIPYLNDSKSLRRVSEVDPLICHRFRSSKRLWHLSFNQTKKNWVILLNFCCFESKFDHLIHYVKESKSLRRVSGQDPLICHRFRSSQRWWHFNPFSRLEKMEQFCSFFAVWVQIWRPYTLCKWKQIIEKSFWTGPFNLP